MPAGCQLAFTVDGDETRCVVRYCWAGARGPARSRLSFEPDRAAPGSRRRSQSPAVAPRPEDRLRCSRSRMSACPGTARETISARATGSPQET